MASERRQAAELQARLSASVQEKLKAECERGRLALDLQHLQEQLEWHQEELASAKEALSSHQGADGSADTSILPEGTSDYENLEEVTLIKVLLALDPPKRIDLDLNQRAINGNNNNNNNKTQRLFVDLTFEDEAEPATDSRGGGATAGDAAPNGLAGAGQ